MQKPSHERATARALAKTCAGVVMPGTRISNCANDTGTARVKRGMAEMLKGGVIVDVGTPEQARIVEGAGGSIGRPS
jgi:coenzyme F420-reducing hydrogenase delta subunit